MNIFDFFTAPLNFVGSVTSWLEIIAIVFTIVCVLLTNLRFKTLYPVGIIGTVLFFLVFWKAQLYASAGLQVYFTIIQLYGWWFWYYGSDEGTEPKIGNWSWKIIALLLIPVSLVTLGISHALNVYTNAQMVVWDTAILCLSILAQFLLDRKQQKHWYIWGLVNVISIYVYSSQNLWLTTLTYIILLINVPFGYYMWKKEQNQY